MNCSIEMDVNNHNNRDTWVAKLSPSFVTVDQVAMEMIPVVSAGQPDNNQYPVILELVKRLNARDIATGNHSKNFSGLAELTAIKLGYNASDAQMVLWSAMLHDIGKINIPDTVLYKPGPLNPAQWDIMKQHPQMGAEIIIKAANLPRVAWLVLNHHEKYDGSGYPNGLKGEDIPLGGRILTVADSYNAMIDGRVYRAARSHPEAVAELQRFAGIYYDPRVVEAFLSLFDHAYISSSFDWMI